MNNSIFSRFYFLTKLFTLFVLLSIIIILLYFFYKAYSFQNSNNVIEKEIIFLKEDYLENKKSEAINNKKIYQLQQELLSTKNIVKQINESIHDNNFSTGSFIKKLEDLKLENEKILKKIDLLSTRVTDYNSIGKENNYKNIQIENIVILIKLKLEQGINFDKEIDLLTNLNLDLEKKSYIQKLQILANKNFLGINYLETEFDILSSKYLEKNFIKENDNYLFKYLLEFVSIKPYEHKNIQSKNIKIIVQAKNNLLLKKFDNVINDLLYLPENQIFETWIENIEFHKKTNSILEKILR